MRNKTLIAAMFLSHTQDGLSTDYNSDITKESIFRAKKLCVLCDEDPEAHVNFNGFFEQAKKANDSEQMNLV
jgi:hypothetical protein